MRTMHFFDSAIVALVSLGILLPTPQTNAAQPVPTVQIVNRAVADVALTAKGELVGRVVDQSGLPQQNQDVVIRQGTAEVARTTTTEAGAFHISNVRSGVYEVAAGKTSGTYRVWTPQAAPPQSGEQALLVVGQNGDRGQYGTIVGSRIILVALATTGIVLGLIALKRISDLEDDTDSNDGGGGNQAPESP